MAIAYKRNYRFFLQNRYNIGQTCLSFHNDGTVSLKVVPSLGEIKAIDLAKKDTPAQTLAYFDSLTTSTTDLSSFLESIETDHPDLGFYSGNFKLKKTYIGYFYNYSMRRMTPVYDDENLKSVALGAEGSKVGRDDEFAYSFMNEVISRITDPNNHDYAKTLVATARKNDGFEGGYEYSITKDITNTITSLHNACINSSMYSSFALDEDISAWKADLKHNRLYIDETDAFIEEYWRQGKEFKYDTIEVKGQYWLIEFIGHKKYSEDEDLAEIGKNPDGTYDFICQFYNGGTCLEEVLGYLIEDDGIE